MRSAPLRRLLAVCCALSSTAFALAATAADTVAAPPASSAAAAPSAAAPAVAAPAGASLPDPATKLPLDPAVRAGRLENGLSYFIRHNARPEKRAEMWLAVNAGSTLEDEDQRGLAHFCEHMAFNGTKNFKKQEMINFLERIGMKFGPEVNAYTSFDETVYQLRVPTDDPEILRKALLILEDWAHNVSYENEEIDKERGVVIEEWRMGRGADARMRDKQFPVLFKGSRYAERLTIGKKDVLEKASYDTVKKFYRDWYRPDLMAVIVVGDVDAAAMEQAVKAQFKGLTNPATERARTLFPVPDHDETLVTVATDPEATNTRIAVYSKLPRRERGTVGAYRRQMVENLYHGLLNNRLDELRRRPDPPFLFAFAGAGSFVRTRDVLSQTAGVQEQGLARGLETLLVEHERAARFGFTATELERAKKETLRSYETAYREREKQESDQYVYELSSYFLEGEPVPGIEYEYALARKLVPAITLDEVNAAAKQSVGEKNRVILVSAPQKAAAALPGEDALKGLFRAAVSKELEPWVDRVRKEPLVPQPPRPATVAEEQAFPELGTTRWKLSNGVVVLLKPTDFKNDQVLLGAFSPGGSSIVPDERYVSTAFAGQVLGEGGLGAFDKIELDKALTGKIAYAGGYVGELEEGVRGSASPQDLETMFQLVYLDFTAPRADAKAFESWKARTKAQLENRLARPEVVFSDRMTVTLSQGHFRRRPTTVDTLKEIDLDAALAVWRERFGDAGDFTFALVGAFKLDEIRPLVLTWLGGLPSTGRKETWKDIGVRPPPGVVNVEVRKGLEPKSSVRMSFTGPAKWTAEQEHLMGALSSALRIRLREVLREDMGGVYGVNAGGFLARRPVEQYSFGVSFGCAPERVQELQNAVFTVLDAAKKDGFSDEIVTKVREQEIRERETDLKENGFWLGELLDAARYGEDPRQILKYGDLVKLVTSDALRDAAKTYLDRARLVTGVLYPEAPPAAPAGSAPGAAPPAPPPPAPPAAPAAPPAAPR